MNKQRQSQKTKLLNNSIQIQKKVPEQTLTIPERTKIILAAVEEKLMHDLDHQEINIPTKQIPFQINDNKNDLKKEQWRKLQKVIEQKERIKRKLMLVENSEKILQQEINTSVLKDRSTFVVRPKSEMSPEDVTKLKELKKQQLKFQRDLEEKTKLYEEAKLKHLEEERQLEQKHVKQVNQKKKSEIKKRLEQLSIKSKQRTEKFEEEKKQLARIKLKKKLHLQVIQKWQKTEKQLEELKRKQHQDRKKQRSIDLSQLKQHEQRYEEIIRKNKEQLTRKRMEASRISNKLFKSKLHQSKFYTLIVQEQEKNKNRDHEKKQLIVDLAERRKQFAESVKKNIIPKMKMKSEQTEDLKKSEVKVTPFNYQQARKKGLEYLEVSKNLASKQREKQKQKSFELEVQSEDTKLPKYHDYLTESRRNREQSDGKSLKLERNYQIEVQEARNIMKKTGYSERQKIQRVKMLAERMEFDPKTSKSSTLLQKIRAKMQILEVLH